MNYFITHYLMLMLLSLVEQEGLDRLEIRMSKLPIPVADRMAIPLGRFARQHQDPAPLFGRDGVRTPATGQIGKPVLKRFQRTLYR